jgi:hypothetical protein
MTMELVTWSRVRDRKKKKIATSSRARGISSMKLITIIVNVDIASEAFGIMITTRVVAPAAWSTPVDISTMMELVTWLIRGGGAHALSF